jgi:hypothetical protein
MMTNFLRFASKSAWETAAEDAGFRINNPAPSEADPEIIEDQWTWLYYTHEWAIDDIGILYNDATIDPETSEIILPATPLEGYHVNYVGTLPDGWDEYLVSPLKPRRVFA